MYSVSNMMMLGPVVLMALVAVPSVEGHARVSSPPIRVPGKDFQQQCGLPSFTSVSLDPTGHIEEQTPFNAGCEPTLCRGMLFQDQPVSNIQTVVAGQSMTMDIDCTIPHGGPANVSLVDTTVGGSGSIIGSFLATFDDFCPTTGPTPANQTNLQFNLPSTDVIGDKCQTAGDCVVQLFWATPDFSQNYYYCVDVQMNAVTPPASSSTPVLSTTPSVPVSSPVSSSTDSSSSSLASSSLASSSSTISGLTSLAPSTSSSLSPAATPSLSSSTPTSTGIAVVVGPTSTMFVTASMVTITTTSSTAASETTSAGLAAALNGAGVARYDHASAMLLIGAGILGVLSGFS